MVPASPRACKEAFGGGAATQQGTAVQRQRRRL